MVRRSVQGSQASGELARLDNAIDDADVAFELQGLAQNFEALGIRFGRLRWWGFSVPFAHFAHGGMAGRNSWHDSQPRAEARDRGWLENSLSVSVGLQASRGLSVRSYPASHERAEVEDLDKLEQRITISAFCACDASWACMQSGQDESCATGTGLALRPFASVSCGKRAVERKPRAISL
jgi:hypothetical protein